MQFVVEEPQEVIEVFSSVTEALLLVPCTATHFLEALVLTEYYWIMKDKAEHGRWLSKLQRYARVLGLTTQPIAEKVTSQG